MTRPRAAAATNSAHTAGITTVGIDVGGHRKGFHAVALRGGVYAGQLASLEVNELAHWCRSVLQESVIANDAPCRWSADGRRPSLRTGIDAEGDLVFLLPHPSEGPHPSRRH